MRATTELSESAIAAVLGRAAEIDARGRGTTPDDLVQWAAEAGISADAVKAALLEMETPRPTRLRRISAALVALVAGVGGFVAGAFVRIVATDPLALDSGLNVVAPWVVGLAAVRMVAMNRDRPIRERFQILNALIWGCYVAGWSIANGVATEDIVMWGVLGGVVTSIAGGIAMRIREWRKHDAGVEQSTLRDGLDG